MPAREKRDLEDGEVSPTSKPPPKKKKKPTFFCRLHGADHDHDSDGCKVINGEIERLKKEKQGRKPSSSFSNTNNNNNQQVKSNWTDRKHSATSCSAEQLKDIVCMTKTKAMEKAKANFELQLQDDLRTMSVAMAMSLKTERK